MKLSQLLILLLFFSFACQNTDSYPEAIKEEMIAYREDASKNNAQQVINKVVHTISQEGTDANQYANLLSFAADVSLDHGNYAEATTYLNMGLRKMPESPGRAEYVLKLYDIFKTQLEDEKTADVVLLAMKNNYADQASNYQTNSENTANSIDEYLEKIKAEIYEATTQIDRAKVFEFINAAEVNGVVNANADGVASWIFQAADMSRNIGQYQKALSLYDWILSDYPDFENVGKALFLKAFTIDENMTDKQLAKSLYTEFIEKYPEDDFVESAQFLLENIDKTNEEIIDALLNKE